MPRIGDVGEMTQYQIAGSNFTFQGARLERLGATAYTLVTIAVDITGSVAPFADDLRKMLIDAVDSCKNSAWRDNLLIRVILFSTSLGGEGIQELHGFKRINDIDPQVDYPRFSPDGMTPLFDATYSAVGAMIEYGEDLVGREFVAANGIVFVITDGADNRSIVTPTMIREQIVRAKEAEKLESLVTILVGMNAATFKRELLAFQAEAGLDQYIDAGEATSQKLAKLARFVSQSVSSQSQAIGTGGPSKNIAPTI